MKAQVIVTPLPMGSKMTQTVEQNYEQLLNANSNNLLETQWWNHYLAPLEMKYKLIYHTGKTVFQIYYPQGKNMAANKEINQTISRFVKKINDNWQEISKASTSFEVYRQEKLKPSLELARIALTKVISEQQKLDSESAEYQNLVTEQNEILKTYQESEPVLAMNQEYEQYQKWIGQQIENYFAHETDFQTFVETLKFLPKESLGKEN